MSPVRQILIVVGCFFLVLAFASDTTPAGTRILGAISIGLFAVAALTTRRGARWTWAFTQWIARALWRRVRRRRRPPLPADLAGILTLSSYGFEQLCREVLERDGYRATVTKQTGDQGIDVELRAPDGRIGVAQAKHVMPSFKIGRPVIQQLYGEMISRRAFFGYVITTGTFTVEAVAWARTKRITLIDGDALLTMIARQRL